MTMISEMILLNNRFHLLFRWSCSVFSEFQLISHKSMEIIHRRGRHGSADVYDKDARSWGYVKFISFEVGFFKYISRFDYFFFFKFVLEPFEFGLLYLHYYPELSKVGWIDTRNSDKVGLLCYFVHGIRILCSQVFIQDLFDDQKGFVKEDSINVAVQIKAFPLKKSSNFSLHVEPAHFVWDELF